MPTRLIDFPRVLRFALATGILLLTAHRARSDMPRWDPRLQPPLPLGTALSAADRSLASSSTRVRYWIAGDIVSPGKWLFCLTTAAGDLSLTIGPKRTDVEIELPVPSRRAAPTVRGREAPGSLLVLKRTLEREIGAAAIPAKVELSNDELTISHRVYDVRVHRALKDGGFSDQASSEPCPEPDGLFVRVQRRRAGIPDDTFIWAASPPPQCRSPGDGVYWDAYRSSAYLSDEKKYVAVQWRCRSLGIGVPNLEFGDFRPYPDGRRPDGSNQSATLTRIVRHALGDDAEWKIQDVPPLSVAKALKTATQAISIERQPYHCFRFLLWGDPNGSAASGSWRFFFASKDGSQKLVTVMMNGRTELRDFGYDTWWRDDKSVWNIPGTEGLSPADAVKRLQPLFAKYGIRPKVQISDKAAVVEYHVRKYWVYPRNKEGELARDPIYADGPAADGFWLRVTAPRKRAEDEALSEYNDEGGQIPLLSPYWFTSSHPPSIYRTGRALIELRIGKGERTTIPASELATALAGKGNSGMKKGGR